VGVTQPAARTLLGGPLDNALLQLVVHLENFLFRLVAVGVKPLWSATPKFEIIASNLSHEQEARLKEAFAC
jgi:hypothetical protein